MTKIVRICASKRASSQPMLASKDGQAETSHKIFETEKMPLKIVIWLMYATVQGYMKWSSTIG